jgi:acetylornithine deacetylase/succinyl-diaminopimelate desuccinylase-like protein
MNDLSSASVTARIMRVLVVALACTAAPTWAATGNDARALALFKQLIEIDTTDTPSGNVTTAAQAMAAQLLAAGIPAADIALLGPRADKKNLVVRLHGDQRHKPLLIIGHLDVVEARRADWSTDPFKFIEKDGFYYGRGTTDMKSNDAIAVATLIRLHQEGFRPSRDIILALTADEEGGCCNGVEWLLQHQRSLIDAQYVLNLDEPSVVMDQDVPQFLELVATEKVYADYQLSVTGPGGHSSEPVPDNVIYTLTHALDRLGDYQFPFELNAVTRNYFEREQQLTSASRAADIQAILREPADPAAIARLSQDTFDRSLMHTTCVATRLDGGHANNALPQRASAVVNCRILPGHSPEDIRRQLVKVVADPRVGIAYIDSAGQIQPTAPAERGFPPPAIAPEILRPMEQVANEIWPKLPVIPTMSAGASDAVYTSAAGLPTYTFSGLAVDRNDDREHGRDERTGVKWFADANEFFYRYLRRVTSQ